MNILAISDRPSRRPIKEIIMENNIELICTLGDFDYGDLVELETITGIPKIGVYGNHCSGTYMNELGIKNMHLATWEFQGTTFGGFQGCVRYKENPQAIMYSQEEASELLKDFPKVDVLLCHCPPFGINDDQTEIAHTGFIATSEYIKRNSPKYLFHGHTYPTEASIAKRLLETNIVYVYQDKVITI